MPGMPCLFPLSPQHRLRTDLMTVALLRQQRSRLKPKHANPRGWAHLDGQLLAMAHPVNAKKPCPDGGGLSD
jgi:hypothetical protein